MRTRKATNEPKCPVSERTEMRDGEKLPVDADDILL